MTAGNGAPRILLTGASGMLGTALRGVLLRDCPGSWVSSPSRAELDLLDEDAVLRAVERVGPEWIFNAAAYTRVDDAEANPELALAVNARIPRHLARAARATGALFVQLSTDYVFDGTKTGPYVEDDPTAPLGAYGRSKLAGEREALEAGGRVLITRTAWLYGPNGVNFVDTIRLRLRAGTALSVVDDQHGCPTYSRDLAEALIELARHGQTGIVHVVNSGCCSWFDLACEIARRTGARVPITPVSSADYPRPARRPRNSVLDCTRFTRITGRAMRDWPGALAEYLADHAEPEPQR